MQKLKKSCDHKNEKQAHGRNLPSFKISEEKNKREEHVNCWSTFQCTEGEENTAIIRFVFHLFVPFSLILVIAECRMRISAEEK